MKHNLMIQALFLLLFVVMIACGSVGDGEKENGATQVAVETTAKQTPEQRLQDVRSEVKAIKAELTQNGEYNCCVQPSCDWCLLHEGECECYENLKAGKEVCPGCGLGWHDGNGVVEGIPAEDVKWDITHEHADGGHQH